MIGLYGSLFHNFDIDFLHVNLLIELGWEFGLPQQLLVDGRRHVWWYGTMGGHVRVLKPQLKCEALRKKWQSTVTVTASTEYSDFLRSASSWRSSTRTWPRYLNGYFRLVSHIPVSHSRCLTTLLVRYTFRHSSSKAHGFLKYRLPHDT